MVRSIFLFGALLVSGAGAFQLPLRAAAPRATVRLLQTTSSVAAPSIPEGQKTSRDWVQETEDAERSERNSLDISKTVYTSSIKAPKDSYIAFAEKGAANAHMSKRKILHQSILGGAYVGFGGLLSLCVAGNLGGIGEANPGIPKMAFASLFPVNLLLIVTTGGQLFTGNSATVVAAKYEGLVDWGDVFKSLSVSLIGNVIGCGLFALAAWYVGLLTGGTASLCYTTAFNKCRATIGQTVVKAILCNWMVSLAVFLAGASNDLVGKL
jgi:formate/nitrite transporter FocA (FNT family)